MEDLERASFSALQLEVVVRHGPPRDSDRSPEPVGNDGDKVAPLEFPEIVPDPAVSRAVSTLLVNIQLDTRHKQICPALQLRQNTLVDRHDGKGCLEKHVTKEKKVKKKKV
jgi:hypothetical protein